MAVENTIATTPVGALLVLEKPRPYSVANNIREADEPLAVRLHDGEITEDRDTVRKALNSLGINDIPVGAKLKSVRSWVEYFRAATKVGTSSDRTLMPAAREEAREAGIILDDTRIKNIFKKSYEKTLEKAEKSVVPGQTRNINPYELKEVENLIESARVCAQESGIQADETRITRIWQEFQARTLQVCEEGLVMMWEEFCNLAKKSSVRTQVKVSQTYLDEIRGKNYHAEYTRFLELAQQAALKGDVSGASNLLQMAKARAIRLGMEMDPAKVKAIENYLPKTN